MTKNTHSIQRVFLEIDSPSMVMANAIKNNVAMFVQNELFSILEKQFNYIENIDNQIIQIEKLELSIQSDIQKNDAYFSSSQIKKQVEKQVQKAINKLQKTTKKEEQKLSEIQPLSPADKDIKTLLYFIENGTMPWWVSKSDEVVFFEKNSLDLFKKDIFRIPFIKLIQEKTIQNRIINQFSNQEIILLSSTVLSLGIHQKILSKNKIFALLNQETHYFKAAFWQFIFDFWIEKKAIRLIEFYYKKLSSNTLYSKNKPYFEDFIKDIKTFVSLDFTDKELIQMKNQYVVSEKEKTIIKPNPELEENKSKLEIENYSEKDQTVQNNIQQENNIPDLKSCYVQNAGLIILHPFLKEILKNCGLLDINNTIINKELAVHILHYAATKKENDYEHLMLFEKFLCGLPLQESIQRAIKIEDKYKQQVEEMLDSVVLHWSALKNTSTAVLRSEFLQREGKLDLSESNPKLFIERKTQDLLLEKIPWNINIIKISWIEKIIYTQW